MGPGSSKEPLEPPRSTASTDTVAARPLVRIRCLRVSSFGLSEFRISLHRPTTTGGAWGPAGGGAADCRQGGSAARGAANLSRVLLHHNCADPAWVLWQGNVYTGEAHGRLMRTAGSGAGAVSTSQSGARQGPQGRCAGCLRVM